MTNINPKLTCPLPKLFPSLFLLNSLREYSLLTVHTSPVSHPDVWLFSSLYWNRLESHQMAWWVPKQCLIAVSMAAFRSKDLLFPHPSLGVCCSALSFLLLTLQSWLCFCSPLKVDVPWKSLLSCSVLALSPPCLCDSVHSQGCICHVWGWPSNLHLQAMLLTCTPNSYVAYGFSPMGCPKGYRNSVHPESPPVCLGPTASPIIFSPSTHEMIQRHLWVFLSFLLLPVYPRWYLLKWLSKSPIPSSSFW